MNLYFREIGFRDVQQLDSTIYVILVNALFHDAHIHIYIFIKHSFPTNDINLSAIH